MACVGKQLDEFVDLNNLECLNALSENPVKNAFEDGDAKLVSDTDAQLLIKVTFRQPVKLSGISFKGAEDETAPAAVKLYLNKPDIGFDEASDEEPVQSLAFTPELVGKDECQQLRFVKFQCVHNLQIFVEENHGAEQTAIQQIKFFGQPANSMDMKDWKPVKG